MKNIIGTLAAFAFTAITPTVHADFAPFTVDEGSVPGALSNTFTAGKLNGSYSETLTIGADNSITFVGTAWWTAFVSPDGTTPSTTQLTGLGNNNYNLYSVFEGTGTFDAAAQTFAITSQTLNLYVDADQNTTLTYNGGGGDGVTLAGNSEDYLLAYASSLTNGTGIAGVPGAFLAQWDDFSLTPKGELYFTSPRPFYLAVESTGDFDQPTFQPGTFKVTGDLSASFATTPTEVPEPGTLVLLGIAFLGLGASRKFKIRA